MKIKSIDMTKGSVTKALIAFALPLLLGNLFNQAYNLADTAIAGHLLGDDALSAIGATSSIFSFLMMFLGGMNGGFSLIIAKIFGEGDNGKMKKSIATMIVFNAVLCAVTTVLAVTLIKPLLHLLHTPNEIFDDAYRYIIIILLGTSVTTCFSAQSSFLRAVGNSVTPIVFSAISNVINICLDVLLVSVFKLGVVGVSLATVIAQVVSVAMCFVVIGRDYKHYKINAQCFKLDKKLYSEMFYAGITMAMMNCIFAIGSLILQGAINGLGKAIIAGHLAARKIAELFMQPMITISAACSTLVSQNYGARQYGRIKKAIKTSITIELSMAVVFMIIVYALAVPMIKLVTHTQSDVILSTARQYLYINLPFYLALGVLYVLRTSIQSIGKRVPPLLSSSIELASKCVAAWVLTKAFGYLGVCVAEPISWVLGALLLSFSFVKAYKALSKNVRPQQS